MTTTTDVAIHSPIGASSMYRWSACPGSVRLSEGIPNRTSVYAEEGTLAHELAAAILLRSEWPKGVTAEMLEHVQVYVDAVNATASECGPIYSRMIEHRFDLSAIYPGLFGTADAVIYNPREKKLTVIDLKYGVGIPVEVERNSQLMYYAIGALLSTGHPASLVEMVIVQPRCFHADGPVRKWAIPAIELLDFAADLKEAAEKTKDPNAPLVPGDHCHFCPAKGICPKLQETALEAAQNEFSNALPYDPGKLAHYLTILPAIEAWTKGVREFAYREALHGRCPPGFKLVQKRAMRRWKDEQFTHETLKALGWKPEQIEDRKLKSPAQLEKLVGKDHVANLVVSESSGLTLAPEDDKRPAAKVDAAAEFTVISNGDIFE